LLALPGVLPENCNKLADKTCPAGRFCVFLALQHFSGEASTWAKSSEISGL
jgi:hypothetical protein